MQRLTKRAGSRHTGTHCDGFWPAAPACCRLQLRRIGTRSRGAQIASDGPRCTARTSVLCPAHFAAGHASRPTHPNPPTLTRPFGKVSVVMPVQPKNAWAPMLVRPSGMCVRVNVRMWEYASVSEC